MNSRRTLQAVALTASVSLLSACATSSVDNTAPEGIVSNTTQAYVSGVPGGVTTQRAVMLASVEQVDYQARTLTLRGPSGNVQTLKVSEAAENFSTIVKGDQVKVAFIEELVVHVRDKHSGDSDSAVVMLGKAATGTPNVMAAVQTQHIAEVRAIDEANHTAILQFADGSLRKVDVRPDVPLSDASLGKEVVLQITEAMAISVEHANPQ
ncbi:hypothetical protein [Atopomonas sediminilitoris]|uniref:hypothetical protein n=1 Tax=Atopomonas sediminilitoris TaxID=2919919 RepID=UPI001F4DA320|nr:hypothetical protein [Atopomonas sediminilitoris]MCJ8169869.1 hypothetical protein [Atopomonas sediminilitoris]